MRKPHGVRGEVRVDPCGGDITRFGRGTSVHVDRDGRTLTVRSARDGGDGSLLLAFDGIDTPEAAALLRGAYLEVPVHAARQLGDGEWFTWQLTGMRVRDVQDRELGTVDDVEEGVANDVLVVRTATGALRFPMVRAFVRDVDVANGVIVVDVQDEVEG